MSTKRESRKFIVWPVFLLAFLLITITSVQAETRDYHPFTISSPGQIGDLLKLDQGLQFSVSVTNDDYYHEYINNDGLLSFPERGMLYYEIVENSNWVSNYELFYNTNRSLGVSVKSIYDYIPVYLVESGTDYYVNIYYCNGGEGINYKHYLYYLPASAAVSTKQTLSNDKSSATITITSPEQAHVHYSYCKGDCKWDDREKRNWTEIEGNTLNVDENGFYTIYAEWDNVAEYGWGDDYFMLKTVEVSGISPISDTDTGEYPIIDDDAHTDEGMDPSVPDGTYTVGKLKYTVKNNKATVKAPVSKSATKITIPATITIKTKKIKVTGIKANALSGMKKLTNLTIGANVSTIGKKAVYNCPKLKNITVKTKLIKAKNVGVGAFGKTYKKVKVKCPAGMAKKYKKIFLDKGLNKNSSFK